MSSLKSRLNRLQGKARTEEDQSQMSPYTDLEQQSETALEADAVSEQPSNRQYVADLQKPAADLLSNEPFAEQWRKLEVTVAQNAFGNFLLRTRRYSEEHFHGMHQLMEWKQIAYYLNAFFPDATANAEQFLFLDLETTGLGSGTGNIPFMIGLAFWTSGELVVQQALIRHPVEERAMLAYLHELTKSYTHLISYNGKSFDWPLMHSRFVMNGMREAIWQPLHIDLLHPSRSLWRNTLESCKLSHIEEMRLGITRIDDVPGAEAPRLYFEFLAGGNPKHLEGVYDHNELDMLSLVSLATRFGHLLSDMPPASIIQQPNQPEEMVRTGLWLEKMGLTTYAEQLFQAAVHVPTTASHTLMLLAIRDKKAGEVPRAIHLWNRIVEGIGNHPRRSEMEAAIELSMYYEHKQKQYQLAYHYATIALQTATLLESNGNRKKNAFAVQLANIQKRISRIEKKRIGMSENSKGVRFQALSK